jgi:peroxiredoxin
MKVDPGFAGLLPASVLNFSLVLFSWLLLSWNPVVAQGNTPSTVPLFTLIDTDGHEVALEDYRGKVVLINFWATWCPPCIEEMPALQALKESFASRPFEILAINMAEDKEAIARFLDRTGFSFSFPLILDPGGIVADQYQVSGLPATLLVDRAGKFAFGGIGTREWNSPQVQEEILPLFDD